MTLSFSWIIASLYCFNIGSFCMPRLMTAEVVWMMFLKILLSLLTSCDLWFGSSDEKWNVWGECIFDWVQPKPVERRSLGGAEMYMEMDLRWERIWAIGVGPKALWTGLKCLGTVLSAYRVPYRKMRLSWALLRYADTGGWRIVRMPVCSLPDYDGVLCPIGHCFWWGALESLGAVIDNESFV